MPLIADSLETESLKPIHFLVIGLIAITGVIHLYAGLAEGRIPVALAGFGFFAGIVLYLLDYRRRLLYLIGSVFTGIQIPLWYAAKVGEFTPLGYADKVVQIGIIVILAYLYWRTD